MGHFAIVNADKEVVEVITGANEEDQVPEGFSSWEEYYAQHKPSCTVVRTSYNTYGGVHTNGGTPLRGNYATKGGIYDDVNDVFIQKQPYASWTLDSSYRWQAPVTEPALYQTFNTNHWDEDNLRWVADDNEDPQGKHRWDASALAWVAL